MVCKPKPRYVQTYQGFVNDANAQTSKINATIEARDLRRRINTKAKPTKPKPNERLRITPVARRLTKF